MYLFLMLQIFILFPVSYTHLDVYKRQQQCHRIVSEINKAINFQEYCSTVYLDVQQAFDKVWYPGLLYKIKLKLPSEYYLLLKSYLYGRHFQVPLNSKLTLNSLTSFLSKQECLREASSVLCCTSYTRQIYQLHRTHKWAHLQMIQYYYADTRIHRLPRIDYNYTQTCCKIDYINRG